MDWRNLRQRCHITYILHYAYCCNIFLQLRIITLLPHLAVRSPSERHRVPSPEPGPQKSHQTSHKRPQGTEPFPGCSGPMDYFSKFLKPGNQTPTKVIHDHALEFSTSWIYVKVWFPRMCNPARKIADGTILEYTLASGRTPTCEGDQIHGCTQAPQEYG